MGVELAAMVVAGVVIGILLDWWLGWTPWGLVVGATLGVAIGMTQFIRRALLLNRAAVKEYRRTHPAGLPPLSDNDDNEDDA